MTDGPPERRTWDSQTRLDAELSRRTPARSRVRTGPGAAVPRGWALDVATEDGLRALMRKVDSAPPTFQRAQALLAGLPELKDAGYSRSENVLESATTVSVLVAGTAAATWVTWAISGSPPALVGWLTLLCAVLAVACFVALVMFPDRGRPVFFDPDARRIARVLPPPGAGGRLFVRVRRDGGDTAVSLIHVSLRPSPASEERFEWRTVADQRFGRGEELLAEDCVEAWSEMAAVHAHLDRRGAAAADIAAALARRLAR